MSSRNCWISVSVIVLFALLWAVMPGTHLIMDEGYRLLQAASLHNSVSFPVIVDYPGAGVLEGIAGDVRPMPAHYGTFTSDGLMCFYSPALAFLSCMFTGRATMLVPLVSGLFLWFVVWRLLQKAGYSAVVSALIPLACTPVLFYSMGFWSYPLCLALVFVAVNSAERNNPYTAYLLVALAALFRIEYAVAVIPVFMRLPGKWYRKLIPGIPALVLLLAGNWFFSGGNILGSHLGASSTEQSLYATGEVSLISQKLSAFSVALFSMVPGKTGLVWLIPGVVLWVLWAVSLNRGRGALVATTAGLTLCLAACVFWAAGKFAFLDGFAMKHPLMVFPVFWLFTKDTLKKSIPELIVFFLLLLMLLPMHTQGPDWGIRHLFLPLFLMVRNLKFDYDFRRLVTVLCFGILITVSALAFLGNNRGRVQTLSSMAGDRAVVTTNWILPGWFTDNMGNGSPVVYTETAASLAESMYRLRMGPGGENPVLVCLHRDVMGTIRVLEELGYQCSIEGQVGFGPSLKAMMIAID